MGQWTVQSKGVELPVVADEGAGGIVAILAHGAGSGMDSKTLLWLSAFLREAGASGVRFNFPYRAQGKGMPDRMPTLVQAYRDVTSSVRERMTPSTLVIGGHSMGGRVASMLEAEGPSADGLLLCSYPLHPPGQLEKLRDAHLPQIRTRTLQFNGTHDEFCTPAIMDRIVLTLDPKIWTLHWVEGADHSYGVKKTSGRTKKDVEAEMRSAIAAWIANLETN